MTFKAVLVTTYFEDLDRNVVEWKVQYLISSVYNTAAERVMTNLTSFSSEQHNWYIFWEVIEFAVGANGNTKIVVASFHYYTILPKFLTFLKTLEMWKVSIVWQTKILHNAYCIWS